MSDPVEAVLDSYGTHMHAAATEARSGRKDGMRIAQVHYDAAQRDKAAIVEATVRLRAALAERDGEIARLRAEVAALRAAADAHAAHADRIVAYLAGDTTNGK